MKCRIKCFLRLQSTSRKASLKFRWLPSRRWCCYRRVERSTRRTSTTQRMMGDGLDATLEKMMGDGFNLSTTRAVQTGALGLCATRTLQAKTKLLWPARWVTTVRSTVSPPSYECAKLYKGVLSHVKRVLLEGPQALLESGGNVEITGRSHEEQFATITKLIPAGGHYSDF